MQENDKAILAGFLNDPVSYRLDPHGLRHTWRPYEHQAPFPEVEAMERGRHRNFFRALAEDESTAGWLREVWKACLEGLCDNIRKKNLNSLWKGTCGSGNPGQKTSLEEVVARYLYESHVRVARLVDSREGILLPELTPVMPADVEAVRAAQGYATFMETVHRFRPLGLVRITDDEPWRIHYLVTECALMRALLDREPIPLWVLPLPLRRDCRNQIDICQISVLGEMIRGLGVMPRDMARFLDSIPDRGLVAAILQESLAALATGTASAGQEKLAGRIRELISSPALAGTPVHGGISYVFPVEADTPVSFESVLADLPVVLPRAWAWEGFKSLQASPGGEPAVLNICHDRDADTPLAADVKRVLHARSHGEIPPRETWERPLEIFIKRYGSMGGSTTLTVAHLMAMAGYAFPGERRILGTAAVLAPERVDSKAWPYPDIEDTVLFALLTAPMGHSWNSRSNGICFPGKGEGYQFPGNGPVLCRVLRDPELLRMPLEALPDVTVADVVGILLRHFGVQWPGEEAKPSFRFVRSGETLEELQILEALADVPESFDVPYRVTTGIGMSRETLGKGSNPLVCLGLEILAQIGESGVSGEAMEQVQRTAYRFLRTAGRSGLSKKVLSFIRDRKKVRDNLSLLGLDPDTVDAGLAEGRAVLALQAAPVTDESLSEEADTLAIL